MTAGEEIARVLAYYNLLDTASLSEKFKIVCPLHEDLNASMQIDLERGMFFCYGCGKRGEAKEFVQYMEKTSDFLSYIKLNKILNSSSVSNIVIKKTKSKDNAELLSIAENYFYSLQKPSWEYIKKSYMHKRGFTSETLIEADVRINQNSKYGIIAPMLDMGKFKGYVCRATTKDENRKYLYNEGFSRKSTVVGNYGKPWVLITEGYMDLLKLQQFGIHNSAAILGWKATQNQLGKILQYTDRVISALDNTETGREGTKFLREYFEVVRFKFPENVKDAGQMDIYDFNKSWAETLVRVRKHEPNIKIKNWR